MDIPKAKPRLAVVSPFLDKRHGTERRVVEWISRLTASFEIHIYSQRVQDVDLGKLTWHRIPHLPGPHLFNYLWWIAANRLVRSWQYYFGGFRHDIVFSPGINCLDADAVSVHIVFAEYARRVARDLAVARRPVSLWPKLVHRKLYYKLIAFLERRVYRNPKTTLILIARRTGGELERHFDRHTLDPVIYLGLDHDIFNPERRAFLRAKARSELAYSKDRFVLLLIGNHWSNKGLPVLLEALATVRDLPVDLLVIGREDPAEYVASISAKSLENRVQFRPLRPDVEFYYAAADAYTGPSLEDTFAQPPAEAMACGLPVIVSSANGTCEIITHESDGLILQDPADAAALGQMIRRLYQDEGFRSHLAQKAHETARQYTWERSARELTGVFEQVLRRKSQTAMETLAHES